MPTPEAYVAQHAQVIRAFRGQPSGRSWVLANNASFVGEYSELLVASALIMNRASGSDPWDEAVKYRTSEYKLEQDWPTIRHNCGYAGISYSAVDLWLPLRAIARGDWAAGASSVMSPGMTALVTSSAQTPERVLTIQVKSRVVVRQRDDYDAIGYKYFIDKSADVLSRNDLLANSGAFPWRAPSVDLFACVEWDAMHPGAPAVPSVRVLTRPEVVDAILARETKASAKHGPVGMCRCADCDTPMSWQKRKLDFLEVFSGAGLGSDVTSTVLGLTPLTLA